MSTVFQPQSTQVDFEPILAKKLFQSIDEADIPALYIEREDLNPSGSHKDRSIWPMMEYYLSQGKTQFVISSSGNAAISAAYYVQSFCHSRESGNPDKKQKEFLFVSGSPIPEAEQVRYGAGKSGMTEREVKLKIFISPKIESSKKLRLKQAREGNPNITIQESARPKQSAFQLAKEHEAVYLRASTDDHALKGYESLAEELIAQVPDLGSIFIPTSSGTCALGLHKALTGPQPTTHNPQLCQIHIVQTTKIHPIASEFDKDFVKTDSSLATAIVDNVAHRKEEVIKAVKDSKGSGWVISDEEINNAKTVYCSRHPEPVEGSSISHDSFLSLAGLIKALKHGWIFEKPVVLLFTGK